MTNIDINALLIGRSGVGKSSLLNYLCGRCVEKTGSGKPVTQKGIFEHSINLNDECILHVYDTWGLEPDKSKEWLELIYTEIKSHDVENIRDWFHFIIYCVNAKSARIEEFEEKFIKMLIHENNSILIALTQSDAIDSQEITSLKDAIIDIGVDASNVITVCSVENTLIGGTKVNSFGREELLSRIKKNFWKNICKKIPSVIRDYSKKRVYEVTNELKQHVDSSIHFLNSHSNNTYHVLNKYCNEKYSSLFQEISEYSDVRIDEALKYYVEVCNNFGISVSEKKETYKLEEIPMMNYSMDSTDKLAENIATMICSLIPGINFFVPEVVRESKQREYKKGLDNLVEQIEKEYDVLCTKQENYLMSLEA